MQQVQRVTGDSEVWGGIYGFFSFLAITYYHFVFIALKHKIFGLKYEQLLHFLHECLNSIGKLIW